MTEKAVFRKRKISDREHVIEDGPFKGVILTTNNNDANGGMEDDSTTIVVAFSTRSCLDVDRWNKVMPSLAAVAGFSSLQRLDLYKSRYLESLDESIFDLVDLRVLHITRCSSLKAIPDSIGKLSALQEVRYLHFVWMIMLNVVIPNSISIFGTSLILQIPVRSHAYRIRSDNLQSK